MIIESVRVKNFRSIYDETLNLNDITMLIGSNGVGKSAFLKAIYHFYNPQVKYTEEDFYNKDINHDIEITICFSDLTDYETDHFKRYVKDNKLVINKVLKWPFKKSNQKYYGQHLQNPDFDKFRNAIGASPLRSEYNKLKNDKYLSLPDYTNKGNAELALKEWEDKNPQNCILKQDEGQFFGFFEVGTSELEKFTRFIYIPAVHDASQEASEGGKSVFKQIMDLVVRGVLSKKETFITLEKEIQEKYNNLMENEKGSLTNLEQEISEILGIYVPDASVGINWEQKTIQMPVPYANMHLVEDGYGASIERSGDGLQRAFIMSMFQYLTKIQSMPKIEKEYKKGKESYLESPNIIIGIEEPELYQHPNRQRYLSKILLNLSEGNIEGVAEKFQIVYTTHSPLFVDMENFESIRKLDKIEIEKDKPKVTRISFTNFEEIICVLESAEDTENSSYTSQSLKASIKAVMTPWMNEGFFADMIVLVEGIDDRAAILGLVNDNELKQDFEGNGIAVIPCMSKNNLHKPYAIFTKLKIPVYCIWDSDYERYRDKEESKKESEISKNHRLLRLCGYEDVDWPDKVEDNFACFKNNLNDTLKNEIGTDLYTQIINECCNYYDMKKKDAIKRPKVIENLIKKARQKGHSPITLEKIVGKIYEMKESVQHPKLISEDNNKKGIITETKDVNCLDHWFIK